jgi:hypothetical protein
MRRTFEPAEEEALKDASVHMRGRWTGEDVED